jgi:hypothetical protein
MAGTAYVYMRAKGLVPPSTENAAAARGGGGGARGGAPGGGGGAVRHASPDGRVMCVRRRSTHAACPESTDRVAGGFPENPPVLP